MKYNKTYYILKRNENDEKHPYYIEAVNACDCPYDDRLFITKETFNTINEYTLHDKTSGQRLITRGTLNELKNWFLGKGKEAYERVINNHLLDYDKRVVDYKRLLEAI